MTHGRRTPEGQGLAFFLSGIRARNSKLTAEQVRTARRMADAGATWTEVIETLQVDVHKSTIWAAMRRKSYLWVKD